MPRIIAILNFKGGVGKTTTTANLGHALALAGCNVAVIDLDPQNHLALCLGKYDVKTGVDSALLDGEDIGKSIVNARDGLQLISAGKRLSGIEEGCGNQHRELLHTAMQGRFDDRDFILLDCPPSAGQLAWNALHAADEILIPMTGEYLALQGLSQMIRTVRLFEKKLNRVFRVWLLMARFHKNRRLARNVLQSVKKHFPQSILATPIREAALVAECTGIGRTVVEQRPGSGAARDFRKLAEDLIGERLMA